MSVQTQSSGSANADHFSILDLCQRAVLDICVAENNYDLIALYSQYRSTPAFVDALVETCSNREITTNNGFHVIKITKEELHGWVKTAKEATIVEEESSSDGSSSSEDDYGVDVDADYPEIDWDNTGPVCDHAKETILNEILDHLSEGKSVSIGVSIPIFHGYNIGTMGLQAIYKRLSTPEKKCKSMQIVPCTAEPFLGCHIICDEEGMYGQKINKMASFFLKKQVYGGKIYGNVLLTRHVE
jgi:hypothetical protein